MLKTRTLFHFVIGTLVLIAPLAAQRGHGNLPDAYPDESRMPAAYGRSDPKLMMQQANELKQLSDAIPDDIANVNKGVISKDLGERLKKIEKLAKKLHEEVQQ